LAFAIPNRNDGYNKPVIIPPNFKKLTYGQFYDITHPHLV
ncbi:Eac protein, partial [Klebsiella pneumoniae]